MSEAIISGAIQKLETVLVETPPHLRDTSVEMTLKEIIDELRMMLDFLRDKESGERSKLNYLLADFADIAQLSADLTRNKVLYYVHNKIAEALDFLRKTKKRMMEYGVGGGETETRPQSVGEDEGVVVGLEEDVQQLISSLLAWRKQWIMTLCIKGMAGAGKTTLARQVYNHAAVVEKFERRAWVSLSSDTSMKEMYVELILQLAEVDRDSLLPEEIDNRSLREMKIINTLRVLVILLSNVAEKSIITPRIKTNTLFLSSFMEVVATWTMLARLIGRVLNY